MRRGQLSRATVAHADDHVVVQAKPLEQAATARYYRAKEIRARIFRRRTLRRGTVRRKKKY